MKNTEIVRSREEVRVSFLHHEPELKQMDHEGSAQSFLIKSPFRVGLPLRKVKLHSTTVSLISTGDEDWSLAKLFLLSLSQASLAPETEC